MHDALEWLEASALGTFMRDSGVWTYPIVNVVHVLAIATLLGAVIVLDLRLLGMWRQVPLAAISTATVPVATTGFVLAAASGVGLLSANAVAYQHNPFLLVKFGAIGLGLVNALVVGRTTAGRAHPALLGSVSLISWLTAVVAGRMLGYW